MRLLRGFFDASKRGAPAADKWTAIGGYIGNDQVWGDVALEWADAKALWNLDEFSLAAITAGEVIGVGHTMSDLCVGYFANILRKSELIGVCVAVKDEDWRTRHMGATFPTPYHLCLSMLFTDIDLLAKCGQSDCSFSVILDTDQQEDDAMRKLVEHWTKANVRFQPPEFALRDRYPSIECADLCAGAGRLFFASGGWSRVGIDEHSRLWSSSANQGRGSFWSLDAERLAERARQRIAHRNAAPGS